MSTQALQSMVKKIFGDEETKQQFMSSPDSVLSQFDLTEQERMAVWKIHAKLGVVTTSSKELEATIDPTVQWFAPEP